MQYKFYREETKEWEEVDKEPWHWRAYYKDGTSLSQFDDSTGLFHQFKEIDQSKLSVFKMVLDNDVHFFTLLFNPETMDLIHGYTNFVLQKEKGEDLVTEKIRMYYFGYKTLINGRSQKFLMVITPYNEVVITNDLNNIKLN